MLVGVVCHGHTAADRKRSHLIKNHDIYVSHPPKTHGSMAIPGVSQGWNWKLRPFCNEALASIIREPGPGGVSKKRRTLQLTWAFEETLGEWPTWPPSQDAIVGKQRFSLEKPGLIRLIRCNSPSGWSRASWEVVSTHNGYSSWYMGVDELVW